MSPGKKRGMAGFAQNVGKTTIGQVGQGAMGAAGAVGQGAMGIGQGLLGAGGAVLGSPYFVPVAATAGTIGAGALAYNAFQDPRAAGVNPMIDLQTQQIAAARAQKEQEMAIAQQYAMERMGSQQDAQQALLDQRLASNEAINQLNNYNQFLSTIARGV